MLNTWDDYPEFKATTPFDILYFKQLIPKSFKILELGCGYGRILSLLENEGYFNLTGIDSSIVQLNRAKKILSKTELINCDIRLLDYPQNEYNVIIALGVLDCILFMEDIKNVIHNIRLSLKSDGYLFVNMYSKNSDTLSLEKYNLSEEIYGENGIILGNSGIMFHHYNDEDIFSLFSDFVILRSEHKKFWSFNQKKQVNGLSLVLRVKK